MPLEIPKEAEKLLGDFIHFPEETVKSLISALSAAAPSLYMSDLAVSIAAQAGLPKDQLEEMLSVFAGMHLTRIAAEKELPEFVEDVCQALKEKRSENLTPQNWDSFRSRLTGVLSAENSLGVTAKAIDIMTEHEHVFQQARIVTDVRPIFATDAQKRPCAAVLIHMLSIFYRDFNTRKQICFALDANDLKQLKRSIERAEAKEATLKSLLKSDGVIYLESK